jgi:spermidine/putrescine transport system substrate-binding protein
MASDPGRFFDELVNGPRLSRRAFVHRLGLAGVAVSATGLAACGSIKGVATGAGDAAQAAANVHHPKTPLTSVNLSNWPLYIDKKVVKDFARRYHIEAHYSEEINDNEEFFGKVRAPLAAGQDIGRDLMILTDWMAARCLRLGYLEPIDKRNVPNARNLAPALAHPTWDEDRSYSLPWQSGMTAIGYNKDKIHRPITSWKDLLDPAFKGRVTLLSDGRDVVNPFLLLDGRRPEDATIDDVLAAIEKVDQLNKSGQIRRFTGNDFAQDLTRGNIWIAQVYSGDIVQLQADNPKLEFVIPEEGATVWSDNMLMPRKAAHPYAAEVWMNYVYDPVVAAKIAEYVNYVSPVVGAKEVMEKTDPELASNELVFPSEETMAKLHPYVNLTDAEERRMNEAMQAVVGA